MENIGHVSEREVEERQKEWLFSETVIARAKTGLLTNLFLWQALMMVGFYIPSIPGASTLRQNWHVWRSISRYSVQVVLNARRSAAETQRSVHPLLPSSASSAPQPVQGLHGKLKLVWESAFTKMIDSGTPKFPSVNSGK